MTQLFTILSLMSSVILASCGQIPGIKITSPAENSPIFKKYKDYTILRKPSQRNTRNAVRDSERLWPNAIVPYIISDEYSAGEERVILQAMRHWENCTCIRFRERTDADQYYVIYMKGNQGECRSFIGRLDISLQPQGIILGPGCLVFSVVVHEIGHALGFYHEHSRIDRDSYIQVNDENILPGYESEFEMVTADEATTLGIGYDYASIQHYRADTFAKPNTQVIQTLDSNIPFGNAKELSPLDAAKANLLYHCSDLPKRQQFTTVPAATISLPSGVSCGEVIHADQDGVFETPEYPLHLLNQDCAYVFQAPEGYTISVQFTPFLLDPSLQCTEDYVQLYDGSSISSSSIFLFAGYDGGRICNRDDSIITFHTSSRTLTVYYHTNGQQTLSDTTGLRVEYSINDVNECENINCQSCINTPGSYICVCHQGYYLSHAAAICYDVNECAIDNGGCQDNCLNFGGGYQCTCDDGYFLQLDGKSCSSALPSNPPTNLPPGTVISKDRFQSATSLPTTTVPPPSTTITPPYTTAPPSITTAPSSTYKAPPSTTTTPLPPTTNQPPLTTAQPPPITTQPPPTTAKSPFTTSTPPSTKVPPPTTTILPLSIATPPPTTTLPPPTSAPPPSTTAPPPSTTVPPKTTIVPPQFTTSSPPYHTTPPLSVSDPSPIITTMPPPFTFTPPSSSTTATPPPTTPPTSSPTTLPPTNLQLSECGGGLHVLTTRNGSIKTLNYLNSAYPKNISCDWIINCPEDSTIIISFATSFRLAGRMPDCPRSQLRISGCGMNYGPYCHLTPPLPFITTCNTVQTIFESGPTVGITRTGFKLNYFCKSNERPTNIAVTTPGQTLTPLCGTTSKLLTEFSGSIQTLNWPNRPYPLNLQCSWTIYCPKGMKINFESSFRVAGRMPTCLKDELKIYGCGSSLGTYCHLTAPPTMITACAKIEVSFITRDGRGVTRTGFKLNYRCL